MAVEPIIFKITQAGKNAMLDIENNGITLRLERFAIGGGKYIPTGNETALQAEIQRYTIVAGDIEPDTHSLRFSATLYRDSETEVWEAGLFTDNNVLFAVASRDDKPLLKIYPDIAFVGSFGLLLDDFDISKITVVTDSNGAISIKLMQDHLAHNNPHPQYLNKKRHQELMQQVYPIGYPHWTTQNINPKPIFDELLGIETFWRRVQGVELVAARDGDNNIGLPNRLAGKEHIGTANLSKPDGYPLYPLYLWIRYQPVKYDGSIRADGTSQYV